MGVEELARRGLPATIFVAPAYVGGRSFWWDELSDREKRRGITAEFREIALNRCRGRDQQVRDYASRYELEEVAADGDMVAAAEAELHDAVAVPGITLGSHSWSHSNLAALTPDELDQEMVQPLRWLHARYDSVIPWLSYPYGRSSASVVQAAAAAGYVAALRVSGGWLPAEQPSPYALPRFNVPSGLSNDGFALRLAGFFAGGEE
jgi:peptidoglycan/xylan/chitin deacetylase (PgdA/CDA1 family)